MSIKTWREEFYGRAFGDTEKEQLEHAIKKWEGLRKENLEKHDLRVKEHDLFHEDEWATFSVDDTTCSLCQNNIACKTCPIFREHGHECFNANENGIDAYEQWMVNSNPEPMIELLKQTLKRYKND